MLGAFFVYAITAFIVLQRLFYVRYEKKRLFSMMRIAGVLAVLSWRLDRGIRDGVVKSGLLAGWPVTI